MASKSSVILGLFGTIIGGGIGFVAGYLFSRKKYLNIAEKQYKSYLKAKEYVPQETEKKDTPKVTNIPVDKAKVKKYVTTDVLNENKAKNTNSIENASIERPITPYNTITKSIPVNPTKIDPIHRVITVSEFKESENSVRHLRYYSRDCVLTDDNDNAISLYSNMIGDSSLWKDTFINCLTYVRNLDENIDYEIELIDDVEWNEIATDIQKHNKLKNADDNDY